MLNIESSSTPDASGEITNDILNLATTRGVRRLSAHEEQAQQTARMLVAIRDLGRPLFAVRDGRKVVLTERPPQALEHLLGMIPPTSAEKLGSESFRRDHNLRYAYLAGAMAGGIASIDLVVDMGKSGFMGFFGAGALPLPQVEQAIHQIQARLVNGEPWGMNLLHNYYDPQAEWDTVDLYLRTGVRRVEAAAFVALSLPLVAYRAKGIHRAADGRIVTPNHVFAKVSRPEVASQFLSPAPDPMLSELVAMGRLTAEEAALAALVPVAGEVTCEADSGGHTDRRPLSVLLPMMLQEREQAMLRHGYAQHGIEIRLGAAGGIGEPVSVYAAFALGADYILTGSLNQACRQSGTTPRVRGMLAQACMADVAMCPSADMFEMGGKVQVLKRGTMYPQRAQRLYDVYKTYDSFEAIPETERKKIETQILRRSFNDVWAEAHAYWCKRQPSEAQRGETDLKHRMALCFRWYLGMSSRWARLGDETRQADYQIWCGPAIGGLNRWTRGTRLEAPENRDAPALGHALLMGAAALQRRELAARAHVGHLPTVVAVARLTEHWLDLDAHLPAALAL